MAANNVGVNCMSYHHGMVAVGAPNRDSYRSGNNAGAAYVFDMAYFNLGFGNAAYGYNVSEDGGTISIPIDRCGTLDGGTRCRIPMVRNSLDPKAVLQYAEYVVGDGPGSRVPGAIGGIGGAGAGVGGVGGLSDVPLLPFPVEDYAIAATQAGVSCPNPTGQGCASTATSRADCHARSRYGKAKYECQWLPGDSKMTQASSFDFSATSDYSPDWRTFSMVRFRYSPFIFFQGLFVLFSLLPPKYFILYLLLHTLMSYSPLAHATTPAGHRSIRGRQTKRAAHIRRCNHER